jgi:hypothetical protein
MSCNNKSKSCNKSKTITTYKPSVHPNFSKLRQKEAVQDLNIFIEVMPPINLAELRALYEEALRKPYKYGDEGYDQMVWTSTLSMELHRCSKHDKRTLEHPAHPTQHARIDPNQPQISQLRHMLSPETLRRTFISIPALIRQIQADLAEMC